MAGSVFEIVAVVEVGIVVVAVEFVVEFVVEVLNLQPDRRTTNTIVNSNILFTLLLILFTVPLLLSGFSVRFAPRFVLNGRAASGVYRPILAALR
jgi:hypothetical protein